MPNGTQFTSSSIYLGQTSIGGTSGVGFSINTTNGLITQASFWSNPDNLDGSTDWDNTAPDYPEGGATDNAYLDIGEAIQMDLNEDGDLTGEPWLRIDSHARYSTSFTFANGTIINGKIVIVTATDPTTNLTYQTTLLGDGLISRLNNASEEDAPAANPILGITLNSYDGSGPGAADLTKVLLLSNFDESTGSNLGVVLPPPPCFVRGTSILTDRGDIPVENLKAGDLVVTKDNGLKAIQWIGSCRVSRDQLQIQPVLHPIKIKKHALGNKTPETDLRVSPQHRILVRSEIAKRMNGATEVLVAAKHLTGIPGISVSYADQGVEYLHILFDQHEIVYSNGAETESLFVGEQALKGLDPEAIEEIFTLFPKLKDPRAVPAEARAFVKGRKSRRLAFRHAKNNQPLVVERHA